jgi:hypothetical protein
MFLPRAGFSIRLALIADLWAYLLFISLLVGLPVFPSLDSEGLANVVAGQDLTLLLLAAPAAVLLLGRLVVKPYIPFSEWAYVATAAYGLLVLSSWNTWAVNQVEISPMLQLVISAAILIGIVGASGGHILDGGSRASSPIIERWVKERVG